MSQMSVQVAARREWALLVCNVGRVHGPTATEKLGVELDGLEGFDGAQTRLFVMASCALLEKVTDTMWEAEYHYTQEQSEDLTARDARDASYAAALSGYLTVRTSINNVLGAREVQIYGISTRQPETPAKLLTAMQNTIQLLGKNPRQKSDGFGNNFDSAQAKAGLEGLLQPLKASLDLLRTEGKETEQAMLRRDAAVVRWERVYRGTANMLVGLFTMAEMLDLAERVRPTTRKSTGAVTPGEDGVEVEIVVGVGEAGEQSVQPVVEA